MQRAYDHVLSLDYQLVQSRSRRNFLIPTEHHTSSLSPRGSQHRWLVDSSRAYIKKAYCPVDFFLYPHVVRCHIVYLVVVAFPPAIPVLSFLKWTFRSDCWIMNARNFCVPICSTYALTQNLMHIFSAPLSGAHMRILLISGKFPRLILDFFPCIIPSESLTV